MKNISARQYQILADHMSIYQFMIDIYEKDWRNGVPAPFPEYALSSEWMDKSYTHRNRIWEEDGNIVAFCFTAALMDAARKAGYTQTSSYTDMIYEFDKPLDFPLPEGYHFVEPGKCIIEKSRKAAGRALITRQRKAPVWKCGRRLSSLPGAACHHAVSCGN